MTPDEHDQSIIEEAERLASQPGWAPSAWRARLQYLHSVCVNPRQTRVLAEAIRRIVIPSPDTPDPGLSGALPKNRYRL